MIKLTASQLAEKLFEMQFQKGASVMVNILQYTDAKLLKRNNPFQGVMKLSKLNVLLNTEYEKGVINQLRKEGKEETEYQKGTNTMPLEFGENNRFIGLFNGKPVIQYRPFDNSNPKTKFVLNGKIIDKQKIAAFIPEKKVAENQGTDKEILWRKLYVSNIRKMKINGQLYKVIS